VRSLSEHGGSGVRWPPRIRELIMTGLVYMVNDSI
jgi:hypothetical protein